MLLRLFGRDRDVHSIDLAATTDYLVRRRAEGVSVHTVAKELWTLRAALRLLARRKQYAGDPGALMPDSLAESYVPRERWLTRTEYDRLRAALSDERRDWLDVYVWLGLRYSELHGLTPEDVTLTGRNRAVRVRGTKTRGSARSIPLVPGPALDALKRRVKKTAPGAPLFPTWFRGSAIRDLRAACKRAKIAAVSHNDLRRTCASWLANAGVPTLTTARILGHASTRMVERVYARLETGTLRGALAKL